MGQYSGKMLAETGSFEVTTDFFKISDSRSIIVLRASSFSFPQSSFQRILLKTDKERRSYGMNLT